MSDSGSMRGGKVVAFRRLGMRASRPNLGSEAERGTVLLFTGVRYERATEAAVIAAAQGASEESARR